MERALTREEMKNVIEGRGGAYRIPNAVNPWVPACAFGAREGEYAALLDKTPCDIEVIHLNMPQVFSAPEGYPEYRWLPFDNPFPENTPLDAVSAISDWKTADKIFENFPSALCPALIPDAPPIAEKYRVAHWWYWLFERFWSLRGMENALCDFFEHHDEVHTLFRALTDFYKTAVKRAHDELHADAIWTSDDIGTQTGPFFSPGVFREFFLPYYRELIEYTHSLGMHFWLHCCGNILPFIPELIEAGLDVLHPIQKYTMDEREIAEKYGDKICIWAGFDVQRIIPYGTPDEVRAEVRSMIDTYARPEGRLIMAAGNNMTGDTPFESLKALLDETFVYGREKMKAFGR